MDKSLADLIRISRFIGKDPALVQAGGGNTSVKTDDGKCMFIKASGTALKNMSEKAGWRRLRLDKIPKITNTKRPFSELQIARRLKLACDDNLKTAQKPSVESLLHSLLDKYVIHLHPIVVCAFVSAKNGREEIDKLFMKEKYPPLWLPCAPPGLILAKKTSRLIDAYRKLYGIKPAILFLAKHGLFVSAKTANGSLRLLRKVISRCKLNLPKPNLSKLSRPAETDVLSAKIAIGNALKNITGRRPNLSFYFNNDIASFLSRNDASRLLAKGPLSAAELIYANGPPMWIQKPREQEISATLKSLLKKGTPLPMAFLVNGIGLFIASGKKNASSIADVAVASLVVRNWASRFGGPLALTPRRQNFIKRYY
ncbi:MAG: class II aldolase [Sedimentisphaerales bacterium]|nr:class II aldolase [Sedimentisphaerales bacterium]